MNSVEIKGNLRTDLAKAETKKLRSEDLVPCVLYGTKEPVLFSTPATSFKKLVYTPDAYLVALEIDGKKYEAVLQDSQFHPVSDKLIHADFLVISADKPVTIEVPVKTTGNSKGVIAGGRLVLNLRQVKVKAMPKNLPDLITIDITNVKIGGAIKVKDLKLADGVEVLNAANAVVVAVKTTRVAKSLDDELEEEESTEEGAPAEEAAAPAEA